MGSTRYSRYLGEIRVWNRMHRYGGTVEVSSATEEGAHQ